MAVKNEIFKRAPYPNWTAVGVNWLAGFDLEMKVIARIPARTSPVSRRSPPTMWDMASVGFSHISVAEPGRLAFLSGQIAGDPSSADVPKDLAAQAKLATASLAAALKELDASAQDIVMLRVYVVNATTEGFQQAMTPLRELLGDAMPSITTIGVQELYKLEIKVEIEMVVRLPKRENRVTKGKEGGRGPVLPLHSCETTLKIAIGGYESFSVRISAV